MTCLDLAAAQDAARHWLFNLALPLWAERGMDQVHGGCVEVLDQDGLPLDRPRRCRVQARQVYAFCEAGRLGWPGPWREAAGHALSFMLARHRRPDGFFRMLVAPDGSPLDGPVDNYDQAFVIFALAYAFQAGLATGAEDAAAIARGVAAALDGSRAHPLGGYREQAADGGRLLQNPQMHLLEAALAWLDQGEDVPWRRMADGLTGLCLARLVEPATGALREFFDQDWRPAAGPDGEVVEPGHQYEWAWLLERCAAHGMAVPPKVIARLVAMGDRGVDLARQVAVNRIAVAGHVTDPVARLWPQAERLKAMLTMARLEPHRAGEHEAAAAQAWQGLARYLATPRAGLWWDRCQVDGGFVEEPAPASSLYHIVCAISALLTYRRA
ncbi:AGE family epimerase/isomerase [Zavarzinia sp. CC-PAN008]|uniref:AGE family epimerase/isomerase n=1 Tax=Zavarzinia sp. CC-PAN008 TaxID=3243332 RepID=UPI003F748C32